MPNPLFDSRSMNDGSLLSLFVVQDSLADALEQIPYGAFNFGIEDSPHNPIHGAVGGNMGFVSRSARDPVFWLHHANIDRHWDAWLNLGNGRMNPTDSPFLEREYSFVDENGATVTRKVKDMLSSKALGYRYDNVPNPTGLAEGPLEAVAGEPPKYKIVAMSDKPGDEAAPGVTPLGLADVSVTLHPVQGGLESLAPAAAAAAPNVSDKVRIEVQGIELAQPPVYSYGVFLNLAEGDQSYERSRLHYVGAISFFGKAEKHAHGAAAGNSFNQTFDATQTIARLKEAGQWSADALKVTLRPITPAAASPDQEAALQERLKADAEKAKVGYKRIVIQVAAE
jgi:tyrosinase